MNGSFKIKHLEILQMQLVDGQVMDSGAKTRKQLHIMKGCLPRW